VLLIITLFLHIILMNVMLGTGIIALVNHFRRGSDSEPLTREIAGKLPFAIAFTVNFGITPLLFVQVLHGHFFYTSSVLMANFWLFVIAFLISGYYMAYIYDYKYDALQGAMYCVMCHPADSGGATRSFRSIHRGLGLNCTYCHGEMEDHAISLLKAEHEQGKERAAVLLGNIRPANFESVDAVVPRRPWVNQPDCLDCHKDFQAPEVDTTFNRWTAGEEDLYRNRTDESGRLRCAACHGSPHAIYPAMNPYSPYRDVLQPMQYQGQPYPIGSNMNCKVCHTVDMEYEMHHPNMLRKFRNQ
jgi:hypothetical protein